MYCDFFNLTEKPFSLAPDPRYLYMSRQHWEALAHLMYGVDDDWGFALITGEVGTGKTTLCRFLIEQLPDDTEVAFIINPKLTVEELLAAICDEFRIQYPEGNTSVKVFIDLINAYLLDVHSRARKSLLIIDEAQCLSSELLEQLRLLTNLETNQSKLLRIILLGQPELRDKLSEPGLQQMSQRITARYHIGPLSKKEVADYVDHRIRIAGAKDLLFTAPSVNKLHRLSGGIPRLINLICDRALLGACLQKQSIINRATLSMAAREVFHDTPPCKTWDRRAFIGWGLAAFSFAVILLAVVMLFNNSGPHPVSYTDRMQLHNEVAAREMSELPRMSLSWWPEGLPVSGSRETAYKVLLRRNGFLYNSSNDMTFCNDVGLLGLDCVHAKDSRRRVEKLTPPAVLKLSDSKVKEFYATLIALRGKTATITLGNKTIKVAVKDLRSHWSGDYIVLRQRPPEYTGSGKAAGQESSVKPKGL
ncbi:MAG: AAA family ATPase [Nitrospirota bacterium]